MITEWKSHSGVHCLRCGMPVPVSAKVIDLKSQIEHGAADVTHAFAVRCTRCHHECVYVVSDVRTFDEEACTQIAKARAAGR
jgi:D-ribose pyranose/furanose isomerase RbsD